jgi:hypothetical protein
METYVKIIIFAVLGAICAVVIAGGITCMVTETDPSPLLLSMGAAAGGAVGSAMSYSMEGNLPSFIPEVVPEMKIGMPMF